MYVSIAVDGFPRGLIGVLSLYMELDGLLSKEQRSSHAEYGVK
jgi:hypothetical protein